jgi:hypothetical protein
VQEVQQAYGPSDLHRHEKEKEKKHDLWIYPCYSKFLVWFSLVYDL